MDEEYAAHTVTPRIQASRSALLFVRKSRVTASSALFCAPRSTPWMRKTQRISASSSPYSRWNSALSHASTPRIETCTKNTHKKKHFQNTSKASAGSLANWQRAHRVWRPGAHLLLLACDEKEGERAHLHVGLEGTELRLAVARPPPARIHPQAAPHAHRVDRLLDAVLCRLLAFALCCCCSRPSALCLTAILPCVRLLRALRAVQERHQPC
eukprot:3939537-Rhodomonas_salina.2